MHCKGAAVNHLCPVLVDGVISGVGFKFDVSSQTTVQFVDVLGQLFCSNSVATGFTVWIVTLYRC